MKNKGKKKTKNGEKKVFISYIIQHISDEKPDEG